MKCQFWIEEVISDDALVLTKIDQATTLFSQLLEEHKNELRSVNGHRLLKNKLIQVGPIESSENQPVWFIANKKALGRCLSYSFNYEFISQEILAEGLLDHVSVEEIWLDGSLLTETMVSPDE